MKASVWSLVSALWWVACTRSEERLLVPPANAVPHASVRDAASPPVASEHASDARHALVHDVRRISMSEGGGTMHRIAIPLARASFDFVDLGYRTPLIEARGDRDLIFNGGYWAYSGQQRVIEGLVLVNGKQHAAKNGNLNGGVLEVRAGRARMLRSADYEAQPDTALALQCSPRLVVDRNVMAKLEAKRRAARTALCVGEERSVLALYLTDDGTRPTLVELAQFLRGEGCIEALNLDGGPSTAAALQAEPKPLAIGVGEALPYGIGVRLAR